MWTHPYKKKTGKQFLDFINRIDQKYDFSVKQIFLVLDNISIQIKQSEANDGHIPSKDMTLFLPTRSPELNLIEVRWLWMHRQAINNSTFENEQDIGKAVSDWTCDYNKKHAGKTSSISLQEVSTHVFT